MRTSGQNPIVSAILFFLGIVVFAAIAIVGFIIFSWLLICVALIALVLFVIAYVRVKFFKPKTIQTPKQSIGKVYDHDEFKK